MAPQERHTARKPLRPRVDGVRKPRKGFNVGPALPEGPQRRRVQQIKRGLIENAKLKKQYAKLKGQQPSTSKSSAIQEDEVPPVGDPGVSPPPFHDSPPPQQNLEDVSEVEWSDEDDTARPLDDDEGRAEEGVEEDEHPEAYRGRQRRPKPMPFRREEHQAERQKREQMERREARDKAERERKQKIEERERFRKAMAKARTGGKNGQRKLGRESKVLLEKVQRMMT